MKSYTNIEQSKILSEILSLESADMYYQYVLPKSGKIKHNPEIGNPANALNWYNKGYTTSGKEPVTLEEYCVPCWSLTALLNVLPIIENYYAEIRCVNNRFCCCYTHKQHIGDLYWRYAGNPVDACYVMILKLHELNLL